MARHDYDPASAPPDGRPPASARLFDPAGAGPWHGVVAGAALAGPVTVLAYGTDIVGAGPPLHVHPYDETFVIVQGRGRFYLGDTVIDAGAGEILLGPRGVPHRFENLGPGRLQTLDIHHSPRWIQTNL